MITTGPPEVLRPLMNSLPIVGGIQSLAGALRSVKTVAIHILLISSLFFKTVLAFEGFLLSGWFIVPVYGLPDYRIRIQGYPKP